MALKVKDTWQRTAKIYCRRDDVWPDDLDIVERIPVRSCVRRGAAIDLVLDIVVNAEQYPWTFTH